MHLTWYAVTHTLATAEINKDMHVSCCCCCCCCRLVSTKTLFAPASIRTLVYTLYDVVLATAADIEVQVRCCCCCCYMARGAMAVHLLAAVVPSVAGISSSLGYRVLHNSIAAKLR
jgi:hypothetical protein